MVVVVVVAAAAAVMMMMVVVVQAGLGDDAAAVCSVRLPTRRRSGAPCCSAGLVEGAVRLWLATVALETRQDAEVVEGRGARGGRLS